MSSPTKPQVFKSLLAAYAVATLGVLGGCASSSGGPDKTGLQLQAIQAKQFDASKKTAFSATMTVFQDLGYTIGTADFETGFITAKSPTKKTGGFLFYYKKRSSTNVTAYVTPLGEKLTKIRLNFVNVSETSTIYGVKGGSDSPIEDPVVYQETFARIQKAIFVIENLELGKK